MEALRESWTDDRLDEFSRHVDERFDRVDERFDRVDARFDRVESEMHELRREMKAGFDLIGDRFESLYRTIFMFSGGLSIALLGAVVTLIAQA